MKKEWIDFKGIREQVGIVDILHHYGDLETNPGTEQFKIHCPFHEDSTPSCNIHTGMQAFKCWGCGVHGGTLMYVRLKEGIESGDDLNDDRQAGRLIQEWFNITPTRTRPKLKDTAPRRQKTVSNEQTAQDERMRKEDTGEGESEAAAGEEVNKPIGDESSWFPNRDMSHEYLTVERGLTHETIERFRIGYHSGRGMMAGRIVIPVHNLEGEVIAFAGRYPGVPPEGEAKYKLPPNFKASRVVYNLHRVGHDERAIILVEGFFDVIELYQAANIPAIALMGTNLSPYQEQLIAEWFSPDTRIVCAFDADGAGEKCVDECLKRLGRHFWVKAVSYHELLEEFRERQSAHAESVS